MPTPHRRSPFAGLARRASSAAHGVRRHAAPAAKKAGAMVKKGGAAAKHAVRQVYTATKEPLANVAAREGVSMTGHGTAYLVDRVFSARWWGGWLRPSVLWTGALFGLSALTGGKWRVLFRNAGQGGVHHYFARTLDKVNELVSGPNAPSGTAGSDDQRNDAY